LFLDSNTKLSNADGSNVQRRRKATSTFCGEEVSTPPANSLNHHFLKRQRAQQQLVSDIDDIYGSAFGITSSVKNSKKKSGGASSAESSQQQQDLELCDIFEKKPGTQQQQAVVSAIGGISSGGGGTKRRHTIKLLVYCTFSMGFCNFYIEKTIHF
jgi:hypothetical protein